MSLHRPPRTVVALFARSLSPSLAPYARVPLSALLSQGERALLRGQQQGLADRIEVRRLISFVPPGRLSDLVGEARQHRAILPELASFVKMAVPPGVRTQRVLALLRSLQGTFSRAYLAPRLGRLPSGGGEPLGDPGPAPEEIGALTVSDLPGGIGSGIAVAVLERSWKLSFSTTPPHVRHDDLASETQIPLVFGQVEGSTVCTAHGMGTLGILFAGMEKAGLHGICTGAAPRFVASTVGGNEAAVVPGEESVPAILEHPELYDALAFAINRLAEGTELRPCPAVLLIEEQVNVTRAHFVAGSEADLGLASVREGPVEQDDAVRELIKLAVALGIAVVEPAGDGGTDLAWLWPAGGGDPLSDPTRPNLSASGALVVSGAHMPDRTVDPTLANNLGAAVALYARSDDTLSLGYTTFHPINAYAKTFNATSCASAIVAGAVTCLRGMALQRHGFALGVEQLRVALVCTGTPALQGGVEVTTLIGVMPDLVRAAAALGIRPRLYIRDFASDTGAPHTGLDVLSSPDLFLFANPMAVPFDTLGINIPKVVPLSSPVSAANSIYARVWNLGGQDEAALLTVYWASASAPGGVWTPVGAMPFSAVADPEAPTVVGPLLWEPAVVPTEAGILIAMVSPDGGPRPPEPRTVLNQDSFLTFLSTFPTVACKTIAVPGPI